VVSGLKGVEEVAGYMAGSRSAATVALGHGTVGWDPAEDTLNPFQLPYPGPVLYPCSSVPGGGGHVRGIPDAVEGEVAVDTLVGWRSLWPVCCARAFRQPAVSFFGSSGNPYRFR